MSLFRSPSRTAGLAVVLVLAAALAGTAGGERSRGQAVAPAKPSPAQEAADHEKRLNKIKEDIDKLRGKMAEEDKKERTVLSQIDRIGFSKRLLRGELSLLQLNLDKNRKEREAIQASLPALKEDLAQKREDLARILVTLYKYGRFSVLRFALEARDLRTFLAQGRNLGLLAATQDRMIAGYQKDLAELARTDDRLKTKEAEIAGLIGRAEGKRREIEAEEQKDRDLVDQIKTNRETYKRTLDELGRRAQELQQLLARFERAETAPPLPGTPFDERKGRLPWPVSGRVTQAYGIQRHPKFNTTTMNNGLEIAPPEVDPTIRAVHSGKVVYADYFQGYGNLLIIDHGRSYYSLYGHCAEFLVKNGDVVAASQPVAQAGDSGSLVGVSLYFEIRHQTKPLDPLQWLSRR